MVIVDPIVVDCGPNQRGTDQGLVTGQELVADSSLVIATFDDADGHPVDVYVDAILNGADDEQTFRIRDLTLL